MQRDPVRRPPSDHLIEHLANFFCLLQPCQLTATIPKTGTILIAIRAAREVPATVGRKSILPDHEQDLVDDVLYSRGWRCHLYHRLLREPLAAAPTEPPAAVGFCGKTLFSTQGADGKCGVHRFHHPPCLLRGPKQNIAARPFRYILEHAIDRSVASFRFADLFCGCHTI